MADLIYFRALGSLELTRGPNPLPLVRRPQKVALLSVLVLSRSSFRSRDSLQAMFWPESDQDHARKSLNTAVHALRRDLGAGVVLSRGDDEIGAAADLVWSDVRAFDEAVAAGDLAQALDLYRGDLMAGFFIRGAPEFERWLDGERDRLRRAAHEVASQHAERAEQAGDLNRAAEWARRAVKILFDDEPGVRRSIRLLDRAADRMGAIQMYERFAQHLQEEYSTKPAPETRQLIASILARTAPHAVPDPPERQIGPAEKKEAAEPAGLAADAVGPRASSRSPTIAKKSSTTGALMSAAPKAGRSVSSRSVPGALAVAMVVLVLGGAFWLMRRLDVGVQATAEAPDVTERTLDSSSRPRIVISQFETLGAAAELAYIASGITAALTRQLADVSAIEVITEHAYARSVSTAAGFQLRKPSAPTFLVRGSVLPSAERFRVNVELTDASSGKVLRSARIERPGADVFQLIDEVARQVAALLRTQLGREIRLRRWRAGTTNRHAWELLHRAEVDRQRARVLQEDGSVAVAATLLASADSLLQLAELEDSEWIDPTVLRARVARDAAWLFFLPPLNDTARAQERIQRGITHADRALARDTVHAAALELRGTLGYWASFMTAPSKVDAAAVLLQAEVDLRKALSADMTRPRAWSVLSAILYARGDFANAYAAAERAYRVDAYLDARDDILMRLTLTAYETGSDSIAWDWCSIITAEGPTRPISAYCRLHLLAWGDERHTPRPLEPWKIVAEVEESGPAAQALRPHFEMLAATILARRGLADSARVVATRAARGQADDELMLLEAGARVALGESDSAAALLRRYVTLEPARRLGVTRSRRFVAIERLLESLWPDDR